MYNTNTASVNTITENNDNYINRYEVRTFTEDGEELTAKGLCYTDRAEAIDALAEAMNDSEAHHGFVYDDLVGDATYSMEKDYRYTVVREWHEDRHFNTAEETADFIAETICDSHEGEEAYNDERSDILYTLERMDEGDTESCIIADVTLDGVLICYDIPTHEEKTLPLIA